jgi:hypothetical protein
MNICHFNTSDINKMMYSLKKEVLEVKGTERMVVSYVYLKKTDLSTTQLSP